MGLNGNKYIALSYKLYTIEDGEKELTEEATMERPFTLITGMGYALEEFEDQVKKLNQGDKFDFTIDKKQAYGEYDEQQIVELPKQIFEVNGKFDSRQIVEGGVVPLLTADGQRVQGIVTEIKDEVVAVDLNHPLAGCDLHFTGEVLESRPATDDEITQILKLMSGEGGCGGHCGGGCGDNCGTDGECGCGGGGCGNC